MSKTPVSALKESWIKATNGKVYVAPGCDTCPCDASVCRWRKDGSPQCHVARGRFRVVYRSGYQLLKGKRHLAVCLERAAEMAGLLAKLNLEKAAAVKAGKSESELKEYRMRQSETYKEFAKALRESGLSGHLDGSKEAPYDQAIFAGT